MSDILQPRILRLEIDEADAGKTIKQYLMRKIGFSSKQLSRFKYRRDGILLNGEKRYVNAPLQAGDILEIRLTQGGEPAEENPPCRQCSSSGADPESAADGGIAGEAGAGSESGVMKETAGTAGSGGEAGAGDGHKAGGNGAKKEGREGYLAARDGRLQKIWVKPVDWLSVNYPLQILYEDQDILAANKPSGVVCHPSPGHFDDTLSNQVAEHLGRIGKELDVRVTGRLDKDTSGIVVFALNTETAAQLIKQRQAQMAERFSFDDLSDGISDDISEPDPRACLRLMTSAETFKLYIARVRGHFGSSLTGTVDRPLRRESRDSFRMIAADDGKEARTHYCVLSQLEDGTSLVACRIEHGRTHQIRVHMAVTGHPIVGDRMYGPEAEMAEAPEVPLMLHAYRAGFRQPFTCRKIRIEAPLPDWAEEITATESLVRRKSMGSEMHVIENEFLKVAVAPHGAELCSIYDKVKNHEVVWQADPAYWNRHAPVLFPFVGKVNEGVYRYKGQSYPMGQHGFARDMDFSLVEETSDSITFRLCDNEESRAKYPFAFELTITHRLQGRTVTVEWSVKNPSDTEPLYFSIGGHPAFNCPVDPGTKKTDYFIRFDGYEKTDAIPYVLIDQPSQGIDFEHPQSLSLDGGFMPVEEKTFDNDAYIFDEGTVQKVTLCYPDKTPYVTLSAPGFPSFGVWSKPHSDAPYICLEPWIGRCDNMGFAGELPDKYGEQCAAPGSTFEAVYTIEVN